MLKTEHVSSLCQQRLINADQIQQLTSILEQSVVHEAELASYSNKKAGAAWKVLQRFEHEVAVCEAVFQCDLIVNHPHLSQPASAATSAFLSQSVPEHPAPHPQYGWEHQ